MTSRRAGRGASGVIAAAPWIVVMLGVGTMVVLLVLAVGAVRGDRRPFDGLAVDAAPPPTLPADDGRLTTNGPRVDGSASPTPGRTSARPSVSPSRSSTPRPTASGTPSRSATPGTLLSPPAPSTAAMTGRYRVLESYRDSFIGEVRVVNTSTTAQNWSVRLTFPKEVDRLRTHWVESAAQAAASRSGSAYVFTSGAPLGPGQTAYLRMHFHRSGSTDRPTGCTVNGVACAVA
ncbi:cellulose binding domain-containing protein [Micromonospora echinofusca]|uniref:Cellulose-binding protein n=1 Tax=Micromonospora echinofusca TaxID=47858 RepID=A0ABS3VXT3_MICEH|nr:cellulose binding domain-containing protein [Micromonospora echinofusca]MBO4209276.1 cellulose-binding protein [Micromonospora echinofusca]